MPITEEIINKINEYKEKNFLVISPKVIKGGANLISDYNSLQLYENRETTTRNFVNEQVVNLMTGRDDKKMLSFYMVFCGEFNDLPDDLSLSNLLESQKEKIVLVYSILDHVETRNYFIGFPQQETINHYKYIYLDYALFMSLLKENNISMEVLRKDNQFGVIPSCYRDDNITTFVLSKVKEKIDEKQGEVSKKTLTTKNNS